MESCIKVLELIMLEQKVGGSGDAGRLGLREAEADVTSMVLVLVVLIVQVRYMMPLVMVRWSSARVGAVPWCSSLSHWLETVEPGSS